ncbi:MAG: hypothetical protein K8S98_00390 [Planctomycetes bacterium]|nr:hypothetical protein [Planctomycetota bacterium]
MTGLAEWVRDARLPAEFGEPELVPPSESELVELAREHLFDEVAPVSARSTFARWKPRVALCAAWDVDLADGSRAIVVAKRYRGDKARALVERRRGDARAPREAVLVDARLHLWAFPSDRELPGAARLPELHRTAKVLRELGTLGDAVLRWRSSTLELRRYKPERRSVSRIDWVVRAGSKHGPKSRLALGARCLPVEEAERTLLARAAAERGGLGEFAPRFLGGEARTGTVFETWLDVRPFARTDFTRAEVAGELLARLAELPVASAPHARVPTLAAAREFLELLPGGGDALARLPVLEHAPRAWVHGDFHPDQLALDADGRGWLLDLDAVGLGDPRDDAASWIADRLAAEPSLDFPEAARELCRAARLERELDALRERTAEALALRAAAALRRLEVDALRRARALFERALDLARRENVSR